MCKRFRIADVVRSTPFRISHESCLLYSCKDSIYDIALGCAPVVELQFQRCYAHPGLRGGATLYIPQAKA